MRRSLALTALLALAIASPTRLRAQVPADDSVTLRLERAGAPLETPRALVWIAPGALAPAEARALAERVSAGVVAVERALGRSLDRARYGDHRIRVYVAEGIGASHVYGGYAHARHAKAHLYLDAARVRAGEAPYLHETTHLVAWRSGSHSLREGLASYVESLVSARGEGTHSGLFGVSGFMSADALAHQALAGGDAERVLPSVGRAGAADPALTRVAESRATYYVFAQSFVRHLVDQVGLPTVLALVEADDTERAYQSRTGRTRAQWHASWLAALGAGASSS